MKLLIESFRNFISEVQKLVCPPATQDLELNTKNRDAAIQAEHIQYGRCTGFILARHSQVLEYY